MIKRNVLYLLAICILSVIHKLRKYDVWVPSDPSWPPSLPRATDFPDPMWTGTPVGRKTPLPKSCDSAAPSLQPLWRGLSSQQQRTVRSVRVRCAASWRLGKPPCLSSIMKRAISWQLQIKRDASSYIQPHPSYLPKDERSSFPSARHYPCQQAIASPLARKRNLPLPPCSLPSMSHLTTQLSPP